ncbi:MAG: glycosyltransferase [Oscillospiraceae bacterium]|nr:glycosyltransferase [Oscillospiraceae bacterium]
MSIKEKNFISCVVYLHNEGDDLISFLDVLSTTMENHFEKYEIICVDDASDDDSVKILQKYVSEKGNMKSVRLVQMSYYQGREASMNAGRDLAVGDFIYEFDQAFADYDPELIMQVYKKSLEGYDIVTAAPKNHIGFSSRLFYFVYNWGTKAANKLQQERFRLVSRRAVNRVGQLHAYVPYRKVMYANCGLNMTAIFYDNVRMEHKNRNDQERSNRSDLAFDSFIMFTDILEKISMGLCVFFLVMMVAMAVYAVTSFLGDVNLVEGWVSTFGLIAFGFFGMFLLMTLILRYLAVILNLTFKKQRYVISGVEKLK